MNIKNNNAPKQGASVENVAVPQFKKTVDEITGARECGKRYSAACSALEGARNKAAAVMGKKGGAGSSAAGAAQREVELARSLCASVERDVRAQYGAAVQGTTLVSPRSFVAFYDLLGELFRGGASLESDYRRTRDDCSDFCAEYVRAEGDGATSSQALSSDTLSEPDAEGDGAADADDALLQNAQDSLDLVTKTNRKYCLFLEGYHDVLARLQQDLAGTKIAPTDVGRLAKAAADMRERHAEFERALQAVRAEDALVPAFARALQALPAALAEPYKRYFEAAAPVEYLLTKHQKNRVVRAAQRLYEQRCVQTGLVQESWAGVVAYPARYPDAVAAAVRDLLSRVPGENPAWEPLKIAQERLCALCDTVKDAKARAGHVRDLLNLRDRLPDEKNLVSAARVFCAEGNLACVSATSASTIGAPPSSGGGAGGAPGGGGPGMPSSSSSPPPPLPGSGALSPASPRHNLLVPMPLPAIGGAAGAAGAGASAGASAGGEECVTIGHTYFTFLFTDMILFCVPKKKGSPEKGYQAVQRFATRSLTFQEEPSEKLALRLSHATGSLVFTVGTQAEFDYWTDELGKAITQRNQCVVFGVALDKLMERTPELLVPRVLADAAEYLEAHAKDAEGIFRLSVSTNLLVEYQEMIDSGKPVSYTDAYCAASIIKSWLRALPEPLLTRPLYDAWIRAQSDPQSLHDCVLKLPRHNRFVLSALIRLLKDISAYSSVTRMTSNNLAIVIAPNILYRAGDEMNISQGPTTVVDTLITDYDKIFYDTQEVETRVTELAKEVARSRRNTLRRRASSYTIAGDFAASGPGSPVSPVAPMPTAASSSAASGKKRLALNVQTGPSTTTSSSTAPAPSSPALASLFVRAPPSSAQQQSQAVDVPPPASPPPPSSPASASAPLSSSQVSAAVSDLMRYTGADKPQEEESGSSATAEDVPPPPLPDAPAGGAAPAGGGEFDVSDITLPSGSPASSPRDDSEAIPPPPLPPDAARSGRHQGKSSRPRARRTSTDDPDRRSMRHRSHRSKKDADADADSIPPPPADATPDADAAPAAADADAPIPPPPLP